MCSLPDPSATTESIDITTAGYQSRDWAYVAERCISRLREVNAKTTLVRLFHGRGKTHPEFADLTVDLLGDVLVLALFAEPDPGVETLAAALEHELAANGSVPVRGAMLQLRRGRNTEAHTLWGEVPDRTEGLENGLRYVLQPRRNQNVGLFLDAAPLRDWVRQQATGRKVLNLFAYTCGFSVAALAGGAQHVVNNDMSRPALDWGRENHALNNHPSGAVSYIPHNLLKSWWKVRQFGPYDLVVIDPPTNQRGSFNAERQYGGVLKQVAKLMNPGALAAVCLNSPFLDRSFLENQVARWCPQARMLGWLPASNDFPEAEPERALKVALYEFRR